MTTAEWFEDNLARMDLCEDAEGYLLGRGLSEDRISEFRVVQWSPSRVQGRSEDADFVRRFGGDTGRYVAGMLAFPLRSPSDDLIGVEFRSWQGEKLSKQHLLPESAYNPVFCGMSPTVMGRIWAGGDVWITEGIFDLAAMTQVVPKRDAVLGTLRARLSERHAAFLSRFVLGTVHMVYDMDETGRNMTYGYTHPQTGKRVWGALDSLKRVGVSCRDVPYSGGKDPGEIWDTGGVRALKTAFARSILHGEHETGS